MLSAISTNYDSCHFCSVYGADSKRPFACMQKVQAPVYNKVENITLLWKNRTQSRQNILQSQKLSVWRCCETRE